MVPGGGCWVFLLLLVQEIPPLPAYNLNVSPERIFTGNRSKTFGYRVRQILSAPGERILVGDPDLGLLHSCDVIRGTCDVIALPGQATTNHMGLTLEVEPKSGRSIVCGSDIPHECDQSLYTNGACYIIDSALSPSAKLSTGYQECGKDDVDLCFLFDGSGSSGPSELKSIQLFLRDAIRNLRNTTVHLAIVQFSHRYKTELDFNQYQQFDNLTNVIDNLSLLDGLTRTFGAISYTLENIFTRKAGHRPHAKKVLLLLTDGEANDNKSAIIEKADRMGVRRYLIGVGNNFNTSELAKKQMKELASQPTDLHTQVLNNFQELEGLFTDLQKKILRIEGVQTCNASWGVCNESASGSDFSREFSSAGLSAAITEEGQLLGDPGVFDWSGGILNISGPERLLNISLQEEDKYSYLGYAVGVLRSTEGRLYVVGAPRHQYVGLVSTFSETPHGAQRIHNIPGVQIGSYFGSEIAVCDVDEDGISDVVLIAAPHFYDIRWSGQVSVYHYMEGSLRPRGSLHGVSGFPHSQFGVALSCLGDLNGDGFGEVAVGAPYEGRGALYIFGGKDGGVIPQYSQRLTAPSGMSSFGLSVAGVLDMTGDGLTDVAVGAAGSVALYRSRPLIDVRLTINSILPDPPKPDMGSNSSHLHLTLQICAHPEIQTPQYTGPLNVSLQYSVTLDLGRPVSRMSFSNNQTEMRETVVLEAARRECWNHSLPSLACFLEDVSPVVVSLVASQPPDVSGWSLSPSSRLADITKIPFQLCCSGGSCDPDFHLLLSTGTLVVEEGGSFSVFLKLMNKGEDALGAKLLATYPPGLSFRKANITQASRRVSVVCQELETQSLSCNVSHPIMRQTSWADIHIVFGIVTNISWPDVVLLSVNVSSENDVNENSTTDHVTRRVPVLHPINIITRRVENSTKYLQFVEHKEERNASHVYEIQNLGSAPAAFSVTVTTPAMELDGVVWMYNVSGSVSRGNFSESPDSQRSAARPGSEIFRCVTERHGTVIIRVSGTVRPTRDWTVTRSVNLSTEVTIGYDETRYHSQLGGRFHHVQVMTRVDLVVPPDHVMYIAGGALLLLLVCALLYKCGFFRRYKDRMDEDRMDEDRPMKGDDDDTEGPQEPLTSPPEAADLPSEETP